MRGHFRTMVALSISIGLCGCGDLFWSSPKPVWIHNPPVSDTQKAADFAACSAQASQTQKGQAGLSGSLISNEFWYNERDRCLNRKGWVLLNADGAREERMHDWNPV